MVIEKLYIFFGIIITERNIIMISAELEKIQIEEIKKARKELNMTQRELATISNLSQSYLAKLENKKVDPKISTFNKIIRALKKKENKDLKAKDIMTTPLISIEPYYEVKKGITKFKQNNISQMPVIQDNEILGSITEKQLVKRSLKEPILKKEIREVMRDPLPTILKNDPIKKARNLLKDEIGVIVKSDDKPVGIVTRTDILYNSSNE